MAQPAVAPAIARGRPACGAWQRDGAGAPTRPRPDAATSWSPRRPGAGKTTFALALAARLLAPAGDRPGDRGRARPITCAPSGPTPPTRPDCRSTPTLTNAVGPVRADLAGYVTTYAQVAAKPALHARPDATEAHAGRSSTRCTTPATGCRWGEAVGEAFDDRRPAAVPDRHAVSHPARRAHPVRALRRRTATAAARSSADYSYGYREALRDGVVRPVVFAAYTGTSRWRNSAGEVIAASLSESGTKTTEATAWRTALNPRGQWVPHVIAAMDERITHLRESGMPDAAGLVLASDQDDARAYAEIVERVTGHAAGGDPLRRPEGERARSRRSPTGTERIAVCVRMVSEGVDVPRAACLAWMTSYRTPLFFAQAVGRVVRARGAQESATVFLPAVRPLLALAAELEDERNHVIPPPRDRRSDAARRRALAEPSRARPTSYELSMPTPRSPTCCTPAGRWSRPPRTISAPRTRTFLGLPGMLSPGADRAACSPGATRRPAGGPASRHRTASRQSTARLEVAAWRAGGRAAPRGEPAGRRCSRRAVARRTRQVHAELRRAVPGPASASAECGAARGPARPPAELWPAEPASRRRLRSRPACVGLTGRVRVHSARRVRNAL